LEIASDLKASWLRPATSEDGYARNGTDLTGLFFTGMGATAAHSAMDRAQIRVFSLPARQGNSRRSSIAADSSPPYS
jgi:hypothetical protein